jgi:hypothetical protein
VDDVRTEKISGEKLKELWRESHLSVGSFGEKLGQKRSNFSRLMRPGAHSVFRTRLEGMAAGLGISITELMDRIGVNGTTAKLDKARSAGNLLSAADLAKQPRKAALQSDAARSKAEGKRRGGK